MTSDIHALAKSIDEIQIGRELHALIARLYPICRSITGDGVRETLRILGEHVPIEITEVPSCTPVFDWHVPSEWNIRDAYIKGPDGSKVVDFQDSNLHVVSYSASIHERMPLDELKGHLHSVPEHPDWIPYRTSYYNEAWGFCLPHRQKEALPDGGYEVLIDSTLEAGALTYGEAFLPGQIEDEILIFAHTCHPSLCNDNLSGLAIAALLARELGAIEHRYGYRFVFAPATIGSITWLSQNQPGLGRIRHGLVASLLGTPGPFRYKRTVGGQATIDHAVAKTLHDLGIAHEILDFQPWGYDERQFNSPGLRLPVGRLTRSTEGGYAEYHTSADNLELVRADCLAESLRVYASVLGTLEGDRTYRSQAPFGEPQLGRRGLYRSLGGQQTISDGQLAMLWLLNLADGQHSLLDIAIRADMPFQDLRSVAHILERHQLLSAL